MIVKYEIRYKPASAALFITLEPGEHLVTAAGTLVSYTPELRVTTQFAGGWLTALACHLGGRAAALYVNVVTNQSELPQQLVLSHLQLGDIEGLELRDPAQLCFQPQAYLASTARIRLALRWAGFKSWLAGAGLVQLQVQGRGLVFFGGSGILTRQQVQEQLMVRGGQLVAYDPQLHLTVQFPQGLKARANAVNQLQGKGWVYLQSGRCLSNI
ncbi:MAG: TIGR00266 family protein [Cyanobacteria bacterium P01_G01_bin.54]